MNKIIFAIIGVIAGLGIITALAAVGMIKKLGDYMKERDKRHENWIDPRNDRSY